jgi:predicted protein tyrosine phosphatase
MINVFSRNDMIDYVSTHGILKDEFYISILPTGGPKGVPIFDVLLPNIITLVFDDVEENIVKDKWPDGIGTFIAQAMTTKQADELCNFIRRIPKDATINIHCVDGTSRSVAIGAAIKHKPTAGNALVYKLVSERLCDYN